MLVSVPAVSGDGLPDRWVLPHDVADEPHWFDELGFLVPHLVPGARHVRELLGMDRVVVVGEPWAGKTYLSLLLRAEAMTRGRASLLSLEQRRTTFSPRWQSNGDVTKGPAWAIVDAVDEGVYGGVSVAEVFEALRDDPSANPRIIVLSRSDSSLRGVTNAMAGTFGLSPVLRLLPLDQEEAKRGLSPSQWTTVTTHLSTASLRSFARYYKAVRFLANRVEAVEPVDVWRGMLESLCHEGRDTQGARLRSSPSERVLAAQRLAAVTLLARRPLFDLETGTGLLLPGDLFLDDERLRQACKELRFTPLVERVPQGDYRFRYRFTEEILAALATRETAPEALLALTTGPDGRGRDDLQQYAERVEELAPSGAAVINQAARTGESTLSLEEVKEWLGHIITAAGTAETWVSGQSVLRWLGVPGLAVELTARLRDRGTPLGGRLALFDVADVNNVGGSFAAEAVRLALDDDEQPSLRERAVDYLGHAGSDDEIRDLMPLADTRPGVPPTMRARVLQAVVEHRLAPALLVAAIADAPRAHHYDARAALVGALASALTQEESRQVLRSWLGLGLSSDSVFVINPAVLEELRESAIAKVCTASELDDDAVELIARMLPDPDDGLRGAWKDIDAAIGTRQELRRRLFARLEISSGLYRVERYLTGEDIAWLCADGAPHDDGKYVATLFRLRSAARSPEQKVLLEAFLSERPAAVGKLEGEEAKWEAQRREFEAKYPRRPSRERRPLAAMLQDVWNASLEASERLARLGGLCFAQEDWGRNDVDGTFEALPDDAQRAVLDRVVECLTNATPTPLPTSRDAFPVRVLFEAAAYGAAVLRRPEVRSSSALASKWVPTLLFDLRKRTVQALGVLYDSHVELVASVTSEAIREETRRDDKHLQVASNVPNDLWNGPLARRVIDIVGDGTLPATPRGELLRYLVSHSLRDDAREDIRGLVERSLKDALLRDVALECYAVLDPKGSLAQVSAAVTDSSKLSILRPWFSRHHEPQLDLLRVGDLTLIEAVVDLLFRVLGDSPTLDCGAFGPIDEARDLRDQLVSALVADPSEAAKQAVERLSVHDPRIRAWRERVAARRSVGDVLAELERRWIPKVKDVVRVLEETTFRFLRSESDLHRLVLEILNGPVASSIGHDLDMLHARPAVGIPPNPKEAALQAYVRRRIQDLLPLYSRLTCAELSREPQAQQRKRLDLLIVSGLPGRQLGSVVVEIKWSHDARLLGALADQLGDDYMVPNARSHGVYIVGLTDGERRSKELLDQLAANRAVYLANHPDLTIDIVALPCQWKDDAAPTRATE